MLSSLFSIFYQPYKNHFNDIYDASIKAIDSYGSTKSKAQDLSKNLLHLTSLISAISSDLKKVNESKDHGEKVKQSLNELADKISRIKKELISAKVTFNQSKKLVNDASNFLNQATLNTKELEKIRLISPLLAKEFENQTHIHIFKNIILPLVKKTITDEITLLQKRFSSLGKKYSQLTDEMQAKDPKLKSFSSQFKQLAPVSSQVQKTNVASIDHFGKTLKRHKENSSNPLQEAQDLTQKSQDLRKFYISYCPQEPPQKQIQIKQKDLSSLNENDLKDLKALDTMEQDIINQIEKLQKQLPPSENPPVSLVKVKEETLTPEAKKTISSVKTKKTVVKNNIHSSNIIGEVNSPRLTRSKNK